MSNSSPANSREDVQVTPIPAAPRRYVADTVALILRLEKRTMGMAAQQAFQTVEAGQDQLLVPAMVCSEIMYLAERKRIAATLGDVERYVATYATCQEAPLTLAIVKAAQAITDIPELHDRLIAATAVHHQGTLLTNDITITASDHVQTLW